MITVHRAQQNLHQPLPKVDSNRYYRLTRLYVRSIDSIDRLDLSRLCRSTRRQRLSIDLIDRLNRFQGLWHQLGHMQVCTSLQTDNHASTPPLSFYGPDALPAAQPTVSKHWQLTLKMNGCSDDLGKYTVFWITNHWLMFVPKMITIKQCLLKLQLKMLGIFFEIPCIEKSAAVWQCIPNNSSILEDFRITLISPYCT